MKSFRQHISENQNRYVEYHLINGKKVILKQPKEIGDYVTGNQVISRTNTTTVHGTDVGITKQHIIGKSAIKKQKELYHDLKYDELVEKK